MKPIEAPNGNQYRIKNGICEVKTALGFIPEFDLDFNKYSDSLNPSSLSLFLAFLISTWELRIAREVDMEAEAAAALDTATTKEKKYYAKCNRSHKETLNRWTANLDRLRREGPDTSRHVHKGRGKPGRMDGATQGRIQTGSQERAKGQRGNHRDRPEQNQRQGVGRDVRGRLREVEQQKSDLSQNANQQPQYESADMGTARDPQVTHCGKPCVRLWFKNKFKGHECTVCHIFLPPRKTKIRRGSKQYSERLYD